MSLSPANILQRLQDLRTWQENHEQLLKKTTNLINTSQDVSTASDYQTIQGLSAFDSTINEENVSRNIRNWESQIISPTKSFDQLLEEKLMQDPGPKNSINKPKKPFLRKGSGLQRFRMTPKQKSQSNNKKVKPKVTNTESKATPLKAPDLSIKPKATWHKINEQENQNETAKGIYKDEQSEQMKYEKALEKELLIFEALEERADNSSFCSTNSSVLRILSSTPSKKNKELWPPILEEKRIHWESQSEEEEEFIESNLQKSDIAEILLRLKNLSENCTKTANPSASSETTEDEKWSTTETSSADTSISSADLEKTLNVEKRDVAIGTREYSEESGSKCSCGDRYEKRIFEYEKKIEEVIEDKRKINQIRKELEQKERDFIKKKREFEEEKTSLLFDLDNEKKKLIKERQVYQTYVKDSQNRPNKKEREEISNLKQEVADLKETMKLKESKNGMTQARLRNQIKQLEKENLNLKDEIEKLTKENAKLSATQKLNRRSSDTKILHEINKNISKLTQESLKSKKSDAKLVLKQTNVDDSLIEMANSKNETPIDIEKQYESTFQNDLEQNLLTSELRTPDKKIEKVLDDGTKQIKYPNGNEKTVSPDGNFIKMRYFNGDIQETNLLDGTVKYFFSSKNIWQTTYADGFEVVEFPDGIKEKRHVDGKYEVILPDDVVQITLPDGSQETKYPDGSVVNIKKNGDKTLFLPNGQKEIETKEYKKREYPDGTVKILYPDGTQETRYSNGRVRIKDQNGILILDTQS